MTPCRIAAWPIPDALNQLKLASIFLCFGAVNETTHCLCTYFDGRSEIEQCRKSLCEGDTFVVWRLDRLERSLLDLVQIVAELDRHGVCFESLTEKVEMSSAAGSLVFHVFAALSEFEQNLISERTQAGLAAVRGRTGGYKPKLDAKQIKQIRLLLNDLNTVWRS